MKCFGNGIANSIQIARSPEQIKVFRTIWASNEILNLRKPVIAPILNGTL